MNLPEPPPETESLWAAAYRIVPSQFPPMDVFESLYDSPEELAIAYQLESLTNDRLIAEAGHIGAVPREEWLWGPGATPIMAAFTHLGLPSRFTRGDYGVYYAASSEAAAISETAHHKARFLASTHEPDMELTMRVYVNRIIQPLRDIRAPHYQPLLAPDDYRIAQSFAVQQRAQGAWGLLYPSVRHPGAECAAVFRPRALTLPVQGRHLRYVWDGRRQAFTAFMEVREA